MDKQPRMIDIEEIEKALTKTWSLNKMEANNYQRKIRLNSYKWLTALVEEVKQLREENERIKGSDPIPTIKPGDRVLHGIHGAGTIVTEVIKQDIVMVEFEKFMLPITILVGGLEVIPNE